MVFPLLYRGENGARIESIANGGGGFGGLGGLCALGSRGLGDLGKTSAPLATLLTRPLCSIQLIEWRGFGMVNIAHQAHDQAKHAFGREPRALVSDSPK
jgi:hypothetical protein